MALLSTSSPYNHNWSHTSLASQQLNTRDYMPRTPPAADIVQARRLPTVLGQHNPHMLPDLLPADSERQYTYSSTLAWASNSLLNSETVEPNVEATRYPSTTTSGHVEDIDMSDIWNPLQQTT